MSSKLNSNELIVSIKRRASIPESQSTFTAEDLLAFADEELSLGIVPEIMRLHEDYLLFEEDVKLVANKQDYRIPPRAIGSKLRDLQFQKVDGKTIGEMTRIGIGDRFTDFNGRLGAHLRQFYIKNNKVILVNKIGPSPTEALKMIYYISPSKLVQLEDVGVIRNIASPSGGTVVITLQNFPGDFTALNGLGLAQEYDFYTIDSPSNILKKDITLTAIDPNTKTVTIAESDLPKTIEVASCRFILIPIYSDNIGFSIPGSRVCADSAK